MLWKLVEFLSSYRASFWHFFFLPFFEHMYQRPIKKGSEKKLSEQNYYRWGWKKGAKCVLVSIIHRGKTISSRMIYCWCGRRNSDKWLLACSATLINGNAFIICFIMDFMFFSLAVIIGAKNFLEIYDCCWGRNGSW